MRSELFKVFVGSEFPFPMAYWFRRAQDKKESRDVACSLLLATLEHLGLVLLADYLAQEERDPEIDGQIGRIFESPIAAGVWRDWIYRILDFYRRGSRAPVLKETLALLERGVERDLGRLLSWRNRWAHSSAPFDLGAFRKKLFGLIERISEIHRACLFVPQASRLSGDLHFIDVTLLKGDNTSFAQVEFRSSTALEAGRVYLAGEGGREVLSLHPFIIYTRCDDCGEDHYFGFSRPGGRKLVYSSIPQGHTLSSGDAYLALEEMFRHRKARRLQLRHFSIPGSFGGFARTLQPGDRIGHYRVEELIRIGGMAQIYRVADTRTEKTYALKLLPVELCRDPLLLMRFDEEARNLERLKHPGVVQFHDSGQDFGDHYLVLELALGGRIDSQFCRDISELRKPLPEATIVDLARRVCDCLHFIHSQGVVHRDLKPGNILVSGDRVLLADFGISLSRGENRLTMTGMPVGTPEYMAPEQIQEGEIDRRTDIYALGCVLYELAVGRPPFKADTPLTTALYHIQARPPAIEDLNPRLSPGLANIIYKAIQKDPRHRYQTARELYDDLSQARDDPAGPQVIQGEKVPQDVLEEVRARERRRHRRRLAATVAGMLVLGFLVFCGKVIFEEWRTGALIAEARGLWRDGPDRWEKAFDPLRDAWLLDRHDPDVVGFLREARERGSLVVRTPGEARIEVEPVPEEAGDLSLDGLEPGLLDGGPSFRPGERISLSRGHYRVTIAFEGGGTLAGPVFVGLEEWRRGLDGAWTSRRLKPEDPAVHDSEAFAIAEEVIIEDVVDPGPIPPGMRCVLPGPFWMSECDGDLERAEEKDAPGAEGAKMRTAVLEDLRPASLSAGFLIGEKEVTARELLTWLGRFGEECMAYIARVRADKFDNPQHRKETIGRLKQVYGGRLREAGVDLDGVGTFADVLAGIHRASLHDWCEYREKLEDHLEETVKYEKGPLPAGHVRLLVALAYAQTHAPVLAGDLRAWLSSRVREEAGLRARLAALKTRLAGAGRQLVPADIPEDLELWSWKDRLSDLRDMGWSGEGTGWTNLRKEYEHGAARGEAGEGRILSWLARRIEASEDALRRLEDVLAAIERLPDGEPVEDARFTFELRLEHGWDMGRGLPTRAQWEKAFRGPDTRPYPWGNDRRRFACVDLPNPVPVDKLGDGAMDRDRSPWGVLGMAGNHSEWVLAPECGGQNQVANWLKGGSYKSANHLESMKGGHTITMVRNTEAPWTGFRVVKEILPAGKYRREPRR